VCRAGKNHIFRMDRIPHDIEFASRLGLQFARHLPELVSGSRQLIGYVAQFFGGAL